MMAQPIDRVTQTEIIQALSEKLRAFYVFPDVAEQICTALKKHQESGDYEDIQEGEFFVTSCNGIAVDDDSNGIAEFVENETATVLPSS